MAGSIEKLARKHKADSGEIIHSNWKGEGVLCYNVDLLFKKKNAAPHFHAYPHVYTTKETLSPWWSLALPPF